MPNQSLYSDMVLWPAWLTCATWALQQREEACDLPYHRPPGSGEIHNLILKVRWFYKREKRFWVDKINVTTLFHYIPLLKVSVQFSSVQSLSHVWLFATPWIAARQASLSITNSRSLLKLMLIELVMPSSHVILWRPLLLLPPIPPSIRVFSNESTLHMRWPKYWSFSFSISPSNEYPGLISFRMDWLDLLAVQGTLKSLLQHHSSKAPIFQRSAFFTVQFSHPYMTTGKNVAFTRRTFVGKVKSLLFNLKVYLIPNMQLLKYLIFLEKKGQEVDSLYFALNSQ